MTYKLKDVKHETHNFWVLDVGDRGYEVYKKGITHSVRCGQIGRSFGLQRAIDECERRQRDEV